DVVTLGRLFGLGLDVALLRGPVLDAVPQRLALVGQRPHAQRHELVQAAGLGLTGLQVGREELQHPHDVPADSGRQRIEEDRADQPVEHVRWHEPRRVDAHAQGARELDDDRDPLVQVQCLVAGADPELAFADPVLDNAGDGVGDDVGRDEIDRPAWVERDHRHRAREHAGHDLVQSLERGYPAGDRVTDDDRRPQDDVRDATGPYGLLRCRLGRGVTDGGAAAVAIDRGIYERGADVVQHGLRRTGEGGYMFRARNVRRLEAAVGTAEVRDRRAVDDRVDLGRQLHVGLLGQPEHRLGNVARHSGHIRSGDRRTMHQANDVEATPPGYQSAPNDTPRTAT